MGIRRFSDYNETKLWRDRSASFGAAIGLFALAVGSFLGAAPSWPSKAVWALIAMVASISTASFALKPSDSTLRLATITVFTCAVARTIGFIFYPNGGTLGEKMSAAGVWITVFSLAHIAHWGRRR